MIDQPDGGPILTCGEVAAMLGVHVNTVKRLKPEVLPFFRAVARGDRRYRQADVEAYRERMTQRGAAAAEPS